MMYVVFELFIKRLLNSVCNNKKKNKHLNVIKNDYLDGTKQFTMYFIKTIVI